MKLGVILSAGGSSFFSAYDILVSARFISKNDITVITDRECGAEKQCMDRGISCNRIEYDSAENFSTNVSRLVVNEKCDVVLLYYSRYITKSLFHKIPVINFHPALLPSFKGIGAVRMAFDSKVRFIGASMHVVVDEIDSGAIIGQVVSAVSIGTDLEALERISYIQKTYLSLCCVDILKRKMIDIAQLKGTYSWQGEVESSFSANPLIPTKSLREVFELFQNDLGVKAIAQ